MALPTNLTTLLEGGVVEWGRLEFKETWDPEASLKTICAFANDLDNWGGGYLVIGVRSTDDGTPGELVGVDPAKVDAYLKDMLNKCKLIQPDYAPITEVVKHEGKLFIMVWAPGGSQRPYSSPKVPTGKPSERIYWIRKMSSTIKPSEAEKRDLYTLANNIPFDDCINHDADLADLNISLIKGYLKEVGSSLYQHADTLDFRDLCRNMNIVAGPDEYLKPKNVGLMFFSMTPEKFFPYAQIDIVEFPEGEGGDRIIEHTFTGPLHQQLRDALQYLKNTVVEEQVVKRPDAAEAERFFNYPYAAIEESLSNAVYHKGYDSREPIEVRVLPDRIEILSHPGADRSISIEGLRAYRALSRRYRNRRVGEFLKEMRLTEGRNTGLAKILRASRENGSPDPLFETDEERLYFLVTLYANQPSDISPSDAEGTRGSRGSRTGQDSPAEAAARISGQLRRARLLAFVSENPHATIEDIRLHLHVARATVDRDIRALKQEGRLQRRGAAARGQWIVL
ncbi:ATP-binding protein [Adlercreutzia sp. R21]|uniref:ATP-binding protein n=1 Tax=Adlercreutzia wanghongyangiae TaxID=3111451 RepID=UPI002DB597B2|nr:ATP-binding protein [Adlercreutzia sp. R21]MEC4185395.1 ATP-binding protein [Adlercreutzia sp. R21]